MLFLIAAGIAALILLVVLVMRRKPADTTAATPAAPVQPPVEIPSPFVAEPVGAPDDLRQIKGVGPKLQAMLHEFGVFHFSQIAGWTPEQLAVVDAKLGAFSGRPERDQWQSQARLLATGDLKAYERVHGKLGDMAPPIGPAA